MKNIWKRITALVVIGAMTLCFAGAAYADVSPSAWYYDAVTQVSKAGYMNGDENGFRPNDTITRAECAQVLKNILPLWRAESYYSDVNTSAWYWDAASHYGNYMGGSYTDFNKTTPLGYAVYFYPSKAATREDFIYGVAQGINIDAYYLAQLSFGDSGQINPDYRAAIERMAAGALINGDTRGNFNPKQTITRAEVAQVIVNLMNNPRIPLK